MSSPPQPRPAPLLAQLLPLKGCLIRFKTQNRAAAKAPQVLGTLNLFNIKHKLVPHKTQPWVLPSLGTLRPIPHPAFLPTSPFPQHPTPQTPELLLRIVFSSPPLDKLPFKAPLNPLPNSKPPTAAVGRGRGRGRGRGSWAGAEGGRLGCPSCDPPRLRQRFSQVLCDTKGKQKAWLTPAHPPQNSLPPACRPIWLAGGREGKKGQIVRRKTKETQRHQETGNTGRQRELAGER